MITFFILLGIAVVLGGVIAGMVLYSKHSATPAENQEVQPEVVAEPEVIEEAAVEEEPEVVEEPAVEEAPEIVPEPVVEPEPEQAVAAEEILVEGDDAVAKIKPVLIGGDTRYIIIKYSKSFLAKLIQSSDVTKNYYAEIKNCLLSYKGVKSRISWKWETFRSGRKTLAKLRMRGKTLSIVMALDPADYENTKYRVESVAHVKSYADTPCLYRVKNDRRCRYTKELIAELMKKFGLELLANPENVDYVSQYPYETTEALIERKLIKELTTEEAQSGTMFKPSEIKELLAEQTIADAEEFEEEPEVAEAEVVEEEEDDEITRYEPVVENGKTRYIIIKYSKSFLAKLIQSSEGTKDYYTEIKNCLLSYKGVKNRISWKWETFRSGRKLLAKLRMRGKTLSIVLALNPADYDNTKYHVHDIGEVKSYAETPCLYKVKNDRRCRYTKDLIADVMRANGLVENPKAETVNYTVQHPYETTEALIERKLIKELTDEEAQSGTQFKPRQSVTAQEADSLMDDEVAASYVQKAETYEEPVSPVTDSTPETPVVPATNVTPAPRAPRPVIRRNKGSDKTKCSIVNIDTLSRYFADGETVTLEEMIKRIPELSKKTTYVKVLARGTLDKRLTIYADSYSLQAVKMIVLTGGTAIKN